MSIEELERVLAEATPGTWGIESTAFHTFIRSRSEFVVGSQGMGGHGQDSANAAAIVAAVNALPALLAVAKAAQQARIALLSRAPGSVPGGAEACESLSAALDALNASK